MIEADLLSRFECQFHHLGVACRAIEAEAQWWSVLGYRPEGDDFEDPVQRVRGRFLAGPGPRLELLMPLATGSPIDTLVQKGVKLYHHAFETPRLDDLVDVLRKSGCRLTAGPVSAVAFASRRIAFLLLPNMNLIELIEAGEDGCSPP